MLLVLGGGAEGRGQAASRGRVGLCRRRRRDAAALNREAAAGTAAHPISLSSASLTITPESR